MRSVRSAVELAKELAEKAKTRRLAAEKNELGLEGPAQADVGTPGPVEVAAEVADERRAQRKGALKGFNSRNGKNRTLRHRHCR